MGEHGFTRLVFKAGEPVEFQDVTGHCGYGVIQFDTCFGTVAVNVLELTSSGDLIGKRLAFIGKIRRLGPQGTVSVA